MSPELRAYAGGLLAGDEGRRRLPYVDTVGKISIGIGRNLTDVGLSDDEINYLFTNDLNVAFVAARAVCPVFDRLSLARQGVLLDMAFNLGQKRLAQFHDTLLAINEARYNAAADHMLASTWAQQVGDRAHRLALLMRTG